jgi:glycosyltransferase involved in cell wall biosynthesis
MHIAYIHQHFSTPRGATGTRSYEMSQRLMRAGHRVTMICGASTGSDMAAAATDGVNEFDADGIRVLSIAQAYANTMGFWQRIQSFRGFAASALRVVSRLDADLVFATSTPLTVGIPGMKGARRLGAPFVFEVRDLWPEVPIAIGAIKNPLIKWYTRRLERSIYRAAREIIALSPGMKAGIVATGYPAERVTVVPNGCDLDDFTPADEKTSDERFGQPGELRLIFTGAHGPANGLDAVLDAAGELKRRGAAGARLIFMGQGREKARLMRRSRDEGLDGLVNWVDPISKEELARVLPRLDVGLMILRNLPAFYFGTSPNKFFDYIASGLPVLNNYPGWLADMIREHECGLAVPPDDPAAFADAVLWLRDHPDERRAMGRRGRALAEARFSRDRLGAEFVAVLERAGR